MDTILSNTLKILLCVAMIDISITIGFIIKESTRASTLIISAIEIVILAILIIEMAVLEHKSAIWIFAIILILLFFMWEKLKSRKY